jgi:hypothetical protein
MFDAIKIKEIEALGSHVLVTNMNFKQRKTSGGLFMLEDDSRGAGIRPRWAQIYAIGPQQQDVQVGQWILVNHGRWTRGVKVEDANGEQVLRRIDPNDILLVSDEPVQDDTLSTAMAIDSKKRWS